jgi:hypothetical protein
MRQKIILTPTAPYLNQISEDAEHVHVLLDTTTGPFTVTLPSANGTMKRELIFKNIGTYNVVISALSGDYIDNVKQWIVGPTDCLRVWSDLAGTWWVLGFYTTAIVLPI